MLRTLAPGHAYVCRNLLRLLPPVAPGYPRTRESFAAFTGLAFDPVAAAQSAAELTLALLFNPQRASRWWSTTLATPQIPAWMKC